MSVGLVTANGYYPAITMNIDQYCQLGNSIEIGLRKMPDSYELTGKMPAELLEKCKTYCPNLNLEMSDGPWWHIVTYLSIETPDDVIVDYLRSLNKFAATELE